MEIAMSKLFKNMLKISLALFAILCAGQSHAMELKGKYWYANFSNQMPLDEIIKNHKVSPEVEKEINETYKQDLLAGKLKQLAPRGIYELLTPANTIIKIGFDRVIGSLAIQQCADENHYDAVKTSIKKVYQDASGNWYTIVPKIESVDEPFSKIQVKQFYKITIKTGYTDWSRKKYFKYCRWHCLYH